jgi:hypothetical protein
MARNKNFMPFNTLKAIVSITILCLFVSCSKPDTPNPDPVPVINIGVTSITIAHLDTALNISSTLQLTAAVLPANATTQTISWSSSNPDVATVGPAGFVTALHDGIAVITATSAGNNAFTASITITVLKKYDLYIAGNGTRYYPGDIYTDYGAGFWKNGIFTAFGGGYDVGRSARAMAVVGDDVYVAGHVANYLNWMMPALWKNGVHIQLGGTGNAYHQYAQSLAVAGSDVYVAGYIYSVPYFTASLWKVTGTTATSMPLPLSTGMIESDAYGVTVVGNDVYTVGSVMNNSGGFAALWKNGGVPTLLSPSSTWGKAKAIAVSGSDIYIAGYEGCPNYGCSQTFKVWKNNAGNSISLATVFGSTDDVTGICMSGNDIYISGYVANQNNFAVATVWKVSGNTVTAIPLSKGVSNGYANGVTAVGKDVFVIGYENLPEGNRYPVAKYWRLSNGSPVDTYQLSRPAYQMPAVDELARAFSIFIR